MRIERFLDELGRDAIQQALGEASPALVRATTDKRHGDYQLNGAMPLAKLHKRPPRELGQAIAAELVRHPAVAGADVAGPGFVNLRLADTWLAERLVEQAADGDRDGVPPVDVPTRVLIDFSSPNIAKQMHVGHIRSTIIGDALQRLLRYVGHEVKSDNHLGDWGTQFGLLIVGMREWGSVVELERSPIIELERVYKLAAARAKEDDAFAAAARAELAKLQAGDAENRRLWQQFVAASRTELESVYARLGVSFDEWLGESAYDAMLPGVVQRLLAAGLARHDEGAVCVFWHEIDGAPAELKKQPQPFIVQKQDGAFLYSTTDLAAALYRQEHFGTERSIYVVDSRQSLHFKQLFALLELLGVEMACEHAAFGTVLDEHGKPLKTRDGVVVTLTSLLDEAERRAEQRIREGIAEKIVDLPEELIPEVARAVGIGAVKYADLRQNRMSDYQFDWDKLVAFKGNAGPYLQYAHARICSIFAKGGEAIAEARGPIQLIEPAERELALVLIRFGEVIHQAAAELAPHFLTDHLYDLAGAFSSFFQACPVLKSEPALRRSRLALAALTARQLRRGLGILGIQALERM